MMVMGFQYPSRRVVLPNFVAFEFIQKTNMTGFNTPVGG